MAYNPDWLDMSDHVVHFTKPSESDTAYENMLRILGGGNLEARGDFGFAYAIAPPRTQRCVCLSEIPLHLLARLADRRGDYGIGFRKTWLVDRGGSPIWYPPLDTESANAIRSLALAARDAKDDANPVWSVTPFVDVPGVYPSGAEYEFQWEREWRVRGDLRFEATDPAFLIIPADLHSAARGFFDSAREENLGPCYECPFIDPRWDAATVAGALGIPGPSGSA